MSQEEYYQYAYRLQQWFYNLMLQMDYQKNNNGFSPYHLLNLNKSNEIHQTPQQIQQQLPCQMIIEDEKQSTTRVSFTDANMSCRLLNLDDLAKQGRLYDDDSSNSFVEQFKSKNVQKINKSSKLLQKQVKPRMKLEKMNVNEKKIQVGKNCQQLQYPMSCLKPRLVRIYQKNEEKFQQLFDNLKKIYPYCTDMDVIRLLELGNQNFDRAMKLLRESDLFVHYYISGIDQLNYQEQAANSRKQDLSDLEINIKKK